MSFDRARRIADAVLYEGYVLYPYRASARKNRMRWQFGVVAPRIWSEGGGTERWWSQASCLIDGAARSAAPVDGMVRFLRTRRRAVESAAETGQFREVPSLEVGGTLYTSWDEGIETEIPFAIPSQAGHAESEVEISVPGQRSEELLRAGDGTVVARVVHEEKPLKGTIRLRRERAGSFERLSVAIENHSLGVDAHASRDEALRTSFLGAHVLLHAAAGRFVSLADPPKIARDAVSGCVNVGLWPVLAGASGEDDLLLCSPIILEDHPQLAPESGGDFFDSTEIDELLTLRTLTLTEEEKREARATDERAAALLDRVEAMPAEAFDLLHGALRELRTEAADAPVPVARGTESDVPWWDPAVDGAVDPETDSIEIRGVVVARGSRVRLRPQARADAQDMFLDGRVARVEAVHCDVDARRYLAVSIVDEPAMTLEGGHLRYLYFAPEEVEPLEAIS